MSNRFNEIKQEINNLQKKIDKLIPQIANARRKAFQKDASKNDLENLHKVQSVAHTLQGQIKTLINEAQELIGIPEEVFQSIEQFQIGGDSVDSVKRESLAHEQIAPTDIIEESLPHSLELLKTVVDMKWLNEERTKQYSLDKHFLIDPFSIVRGLRLKSEFSDAHRFAQGLLLAEDYLNKNPSYDFWAGSLLIPQICSLGMKFPFLKDVKGDVNERINSLWKRGSEFSDSTVFELLVAASCTSFGRTMEFLSTNSLKTPDLRVQNFHIPLVVECKRKRPLSIHEQEEEHLMNVLFFKLYKACDEKGISGIFELRLNVEAGKMPSEDIVKSATGLRFAPDYKKNYEFGWGKISFHPLSNKVHLSDTKLYSPYFLKSVFNWDSDLPRSDGFICKVKPPEGICVNVVDNPVGLIWSICTEKSIKHKTWTMASSFGRATKQVPEGEAGIIYMCFQDGTIPRYVDEKIDLLVSQMNQWEHIGSIRLPISFVIRLLPRPLHHGSPDLIENGFRFCSELYGDPILFTDFPSCVFHEQPQ